MRDIALVIVFFGTLPMIFSRPYVGVLVWSWLSYMNPHRLTWGFAYDLPFAQIVAIILLLSVLLRGEKIKLPNTAIVYVWILFIFWMLITSLNAFYSELAFEYYIQVIKIQLFCVLTIALVNDMKKLNQLMMVITLSIGYYSIKGGIFTVLTGGSFRVYGPAGSFFSENNSLAIATLMILPIMYYLHKVSVKKLQKYFWLFVIVASAFSVLGSQSRGALVSIAAVILFFWLKSSSKLLSALVMVIFMATGYQFMPSSWHERMQTTINYKEDASATSRLDSWRFNLNVANANFTGGGFNKESRATYDIYLPGDYRPYVAHSIYFSVLGDHGWIGLILFLVLLVSTWLRLSTVIREATGLENFQHMVTLAKMLQISLIAYASGGAFLNLAYFDLPWHIIAMALILEREMNQQRRIKEENSDQAIPVVRHTTR